MSYTGSVFLEFNPDLNPPDKSSEIRDGLSAIVQVGNTLWVANDETLTLERLSRHKGVTDQDYRYGDHEQFALADYLSLPKPPPEDRTKKRQEADLEGLDYKDGYLWLVGSHSLKRGSPELGKLPKENKERLAEVDPKENRFLLARIPLIEEGETYTLKKEIKQGGKKYTAARLPSDDKGNDLTKALAKDDHLKHFLAIPSKDNGLDIEGLAVMGDRLFLGLRGPVLGGWAVILELELEEEDDFILKLKKIGPDDQPYRKHFLQLNGLGIRDLCVLGNELLILAGPTMMLDGPVFLFRWAGGAKPDKQSLVFKEELEGARVKLPLSQEEGFDHPEGITLFSPDGGSANSLLIVYDSAAKARHKGTVGSVEADIFGLP